MGSSVLPGLKSQAKAKEVQGTACYVLSTIW